MKCCCSCDRPADFKWAYGKAEPQHWCNQCFDNVHNDAVIDLKNEMCVMAAEHQEEKKKIN